MIEAAEGRLGREFLVVHVMECVGKFAKVALDRDLPDLPDTGADELLQVPGESDPGGSGRSTRRVLPVKIGDLVQDYIRHQGLGADGRGIVEVLPAQLVGIVTEHIGLAGGRTDLLFQSQQHRNVLERVQSVRDEKRDDDDIRGIRHLIPIRNEWLFLHVGVRHQRVARPGCGDEIRLVPDGFRRVLVQPGAVPGDDQRGVRRIRVRCNLLRPAEDQACHRRMDAHRQAIMEGFPVAHRRVPRKLELPRDDVLGEIPFADEIGDDIDLRGIDHEKRLAHRRLLLPEADMDFSKDAPLPYFLRMVEIRGR